MKDGALRRLVERTRSLLDDLDRARPELLSVGELNRSLRQILENQLAIMEAFEVQRADAALAPTQAVQRQIKVSPAHGSNGSLPSPRPEPEAAELIEDPILELEAELEEEPEDDPPADVLGESRVVSAHQARLFVEEFDNRDKDFDKGLDKMNRWVAAGASGTPFQWRGDRAYLNVRGAGPTNARNYEEPLMTRMGFSRRIGRLVVPGLEGDVVVYERPS